MKRGIKTGPKPKKVVDVRWRANLAYAIGLITADGCLSKDGLLVDLTSSEQEQLVNYSHCLGLDLKIGAKSFYKGKQSFRVQFKNRLFYDFLLSIGLTPRKSRTIGELAIPRKYFFDFLRGLFDGDGCSYSYWDPRWKSSYMFYVCFTSGSKKFIDWIQRETYSHLKVHGHITSTKNKHICYQLKYAKCDGIKVVRGMYKGKDCVCLKRKRLKINESMSIMGELSI